MSCVPHVFASVHCCLVDTCSKRAELLALVSDVYFIFVTFPCGILGQVWYLIVSIPDLCPLSYFVCWVIFNFCCLLLTFFKISFFLKYYYRNTIRVSSGFGPDHEVHSFIPGLSPNCLQRLSPDGKRSSQARKVLKLSLNNVLYQLPLIIASFLHTDLINVAYLTACDLSCHYDVAFFE